MSDHSHFIVHKPYGTLSQFVNNQRKRKNKNLLGQLHNFPHGTMSIGRLDENSEGLLLLTTDGKVSNLVCSRKIEKEYYAQVDGLITDEAIEKLTQGVEIGIRDKKYNTLPCKAKRLITKPNIVPSAKGIRSDRHGPTSWVSIILTEGKLRQVRKMTAAVGFPTLRLIRVRIGNEYLNTLAAGEVKEVDRFDIE